MCTINVGTLGNAGLTPWRGFTISAVDTAPVGGKLVDALFYLGEHKIGDGKSPVSDASLGLSSKAHLEEVIKSLDVSIPDGTSAEDIGNMIRIISAR